MRQGPVPLWGCCLTVRPKVPALTACEHTDWVRPGTWGHVATEGWGSGRGGRCRDGGKRGSSRCVQPLALHTFTYMTGLVIKTQRAGQEDTPA